MRAANDKDRALPEAEDGCEQATGDTSEPEPGQQAEEPVGEAAELPIRPGVGQPHVCHGSPLPCPFIHDPDAASHRPSPLRTAGTPGRPGDGPAHRPTACRAARTVPTNLLL